MQVRYIVSMAGNGVDYPAFEKDKKGNWVYYDVSELEAVNLINADMAVAKDDKEYTTASAKVETLKAQKVKADQLAKDLLILEDLKAEKVKLTTELKELNARIAEVEATQKA